jgi:hypothetical protein
MCGGGEGELGLGREGHHSEWGGGRRQQPASGRSGSALCFGWDCRVEKTRRTQRKVGATTAGKFEQPFPFQQVSVVRVHRPYG